MTEKEKRTILDMRAAGKQYQAIRFFQMSGLF